MKTSRRIFDSVTMRTLGKRLRKVRGDRTLAEFSEKISVGRTTWSNYEAGRRLPSHEVLEVLRKVEGVPPDRILPSPALVREMIPTETNNWWSYTPALWLFARVKGIKKFDSEAAELQWWAERIQPLAQEFESRNFEIADKRDLEFHVAAIEVCSNLSERTEPELLAFVDPAQ